MRMLLACSLLAAPLFAQTPRQPGRPTTGQAGQQAQQATTDITGTVVEDATQKGVSHASVSVRTKAGALVAGAIADTLGQFRIQGVRQGTYTLRATYIGYGPKTLEITANSAKTETGNVALTRVAVTLGNVQIRGVAEAATIEVDRNSYRPKAIAAAANNASEVLENVPSVQVDGEGKVSYRGNENVVVQINGRPTPMRGTQLGAYLKQIPANMLEKVEVIPNPSAKYDPEGMAGIVNIVLKEAVDLGASAGFNASAASKDRASLSGNGAYQVGAITLISSYGYNREKRDLTGLNNRQRLLQTGPWMSALTEQDVRGDQQTQGHNLTASADYKPNKTEAITNTLLLNRRGGQEDGNIGVSEKSSDGALLDSYLQLRDRSSTATTTDNTIAWKRTTVARKKETGAEIRYVRTADNAADRQWRQERATGERSGVENTDTANNLQSLTTQADATRTIGTARLETGYKGTWKWNDQSYVVNLDKEGDGSFTPSDRSNNFKFDESVNAAYGVASRSAGKMDLQAGVRAEYATRNFRLTGEEFAHDYSSLFPSAAASYSTSPTTQWKISYSRRIRRPGTQELNPFPQFMDAQNVFIGNPRLRPEYTHALEGGMTKTVSFETIQLSPFYRKTSDIIRVNINTDSLIEGRSVTAVSFRNLATSSSYGADLNSTWKIGPKLSGVGAFNVFRMVTDGGGETAVASDALAWSTRLNATYNPTTKLSLQGNLNYRGPINLEQARFYSITFMNLSARYKIDGERKVITLRAIDPLGKAGIRLRAQDGNIIQVTERNFGLKAVFLGLQMNFGQAPRLRQPQPQTTEPAQPGFPGGV